MLKNRTERSYEQVVYKDKQTGKTKVIGAAGWKRLKTKTTGSGRKVEPRYTRLTGKAAEKVLASRAGEAIAAPTAAEKAAKAKEEAAMNLLAKALRLKKVPVNRDGDNVVLTEEPTEEGGEPVVTTMHYKEAQADEAFMAKVEKLVAACKGCR